MTKFLLIAAILFKVTTVLSQTTGYLLVNVNGTFTLPNGAIVTIVDSNTYSTKYRCDTGRVNMWNAMNGKQVAGSYASGVTNTGDNAVNTLYSGFAASKVNVSDTSSMLTNYRNGLNSGIAATALKVNITDTSGMLTNYRNGLNSLIATKVNASDTSSMLANYRTGLNTGIVNTNLRATITTTDSMRTNIYGAFNGVTVSLAAKLATNGSAASLTSIPVAQATGVLPFANGGRAGSAVMAATTGTFSQAMSSEILTCTPTGAMTINATGGAAGQRITFVFLTSGVTSFTITFNTNFIKTGTLATGTTTARRFCVSWVYDGSLWLETGRTAAMQ